MVLKVREETREFLKKHPNERFTGRQIAEWMFETYPAECEEKRQNSKQGLDDAGLINQIYAQVTNSRYDNQKNDPNFKTTAEKPRKYYYSEISDEEEVAESTSSPDKKISEADLYPILADYLNAEHNLFSKRIEEGTSSNRSGAGGNKWLHPDLVAVELLGANWEDEIKQLHKAYGNKNSKIWAFEVKLKIKRYNVREYFFQTVSNSSWANFGFLVAGEIDDDEKLNDELLLLSNLHGIGVIKLDSDNTAKSNIIIPAREREIDWATANRLAYENSDFKTFINTIETVLSTPKADIDKHWKTEKTFRLEKFSNAGFDTPPSDDD